MTPVNKPLPDSNLNHDKLNTVSPALFSGEAFRLLDLPGELRVYIYQFVLPHDLNICFEKVERPIPRRCTRPHPPIGSQNDEPEWRVTAVPKLGDQLQYVIGTERPFHHKHPSVETQLFRVNKFVLNEVQAILYGSKTFKFTIDSDSHFPVSLRSPHIFGPLGDISIRLPLLRNLRSIHIDVCVHVKRHWAVKRQRSRLEYFVEVLKQHADDLNRKSLLQEMKVDCRLAQRFRVDHQNKKTPEDTERFMFSLESLTSLRGIKDVKVTGVPEWYAKCLQLCIQGKGGDVEEFDWPLIQVRRRRESWRTTWKKVSVTSRQWNQPMLNWRGFAERNGIELPEDVGKFGKWSTGRLCLWDQYLILSIVSFVY